LVVGDPDLSRDPKWLFPSLPGARSEASEVGRLLGVPVLLGPAATRTAVTAAISRPDGLDLIYLATHAITDPENPQDGSFVALAGGHLYTRDIEKTKLKGRPLVVLSACETGRGKAFDGGIFGMALAWHYAGADSVVTSLWNVNDAATRDLMVDFMNLVQTVPPSRALAEAMRKQRVTRPEPANWASFAVYGGLPTEF
jgi:CHAT domain-containing protein